MYNISSYSLWLYCLPFVGIVGFILGIKMLSHPRTARKGNGIASLGMLIAIVATLTAGEVLDFKMIGIAILIGSVIGGIIAQRIEMTQMPQMDIRTNECR